MSERKRIRVRVGTPVEGRNWYSQPCINITSCHSIDPDGYTVDALLAKLQEWKKKYSGQYENLGFREANDCDCRYDCSCSPTYYLMGTRLENDLEYKFRLAAEAKRAEEQRKRDEEQLAAIAARLGKRVV